LQNCGFSDFLELGSCNTQCSEAKGSSLFDSVLDQGSNVLNSRIEKHANS